ncbi:MAG: coenzyme F420-0:L-glutamate ligase [Actinomycetota bacterium]|nr:coenzyme F420-0:L-glutamate ligase [Actinomycetota bacterium]
MNSIQIHPLPGIPEIEPGDDVAAAILEAAATAPTGFHQGDVLVVTHKIVSKAEGRIIDAGDDVAYRAAVEDEARSVVRRRGDLVITQTRHGFICANAGVDRSNVTGGRAVLLPVDPDRSAHGIRMRILQATDIDVPVIISDTFGRPWRRGQTDIAIGVSGMKAIEDHKGRPDANGRIMEATEVALIDEIAAAADLAMGKATRIPAAIVRGVTWEPGPGRATDLVRPPHEDLFR